MHVFSPQIFDSLEHLIKNDLREKGEFQLTAAQEHLRQQTHGKYWAVVSQGQRYDTVITVCDSAAELCPVFPGAPQRIHWSIWDPGEATGSHEEKLAAFCRVRDDLASRLRQFLSSRAKSQNF